MFGVGFLELVIIGVAVLIAAGPDKMPQFFLHIAKLFREWSRLKNDVHYQFSALEEELKTAHPKTIVLADVNTEPRAAEQKIVEQQPPVEKPAKEEIS